MLSRQLRSPWSKLRALSELPQFFGRIAQYRDEFVIYDDGFRGYTFRYLDIARMAACFAARLRADGVRKGDAVMIWSESRPGWVAALWGCLLEGAIVVPVEPQSSHELFRKIEQKVRPRLVLLGDRVPSVPYATELPVWRLSEIEQAGEPTNLEPVPLYADDVAEIVFTSGTTAEPKGVIITHRNLAAQLRPIEDQIAPYRKYVRPFAPLRILNLLPMSHLFGQSLATFVPPLVPASVVFISSTSPHEIARQLRRRRIAILVSVPKVLEVLRDFVLHRFPEAADTRNSGAAWPLRWWRFRAIHRMFGCRFCCLVSGGAPLPSDLEQFWANLGFVVVQGYGLTETAPVISFSHPFHVRHGTAGRPLTGIDVKIAEDGEVLVRGESVTPGYFEAPQQTSKAFREGWFHTGDYGERDIEGNLVIRGRKKEIIVTPEGLKVFPEDVEAVLNLLPGVRESAVIGQDRVHAVLVLNSGADVDAIVRQANAKLEDHQKIRSISIWTGTELPRTKTTSKLRRAEIASAIEYGVGQPVSKPGTDLAGLIEKYAPGRTIRPDTTIEELGLSSLDRVELMMDLEEKLGASVDERAFASVTKVAGLATPLPPAEETTFPTYNRSWIAKLIRGVVARKCPSSHREDDRSAQSIRPRKPNFPSWPCDFCGKSSEPLRYADHPGEPALVLAAQDRPGNVEGVLRRAFPSGEVLAHPALDEQLLIFADRSPLQWIPDPTNRSRGGRIDPIHGRIGGGGLVDLDFPRRAKVRSLVTLVDSFPVSE